ncbi:MAG: S9 family peptidase [Pseudomonadota bacterium]
MHDAPTRSRRGRLLSAATALLILWSTMAPAAGPKLEAFATLGSLQQIELSPDGSWVAYLYPLNGRQVVIAHPVTDASNPTILPLSSESFVKWFTWGNDKQIVVSYGFTQTERFFGQLTLLGGGDLEQTRLFAFARDGSDSKRPVRLAMPESRCGAGRRVGNRCPEPLFQDDVIDWMRDDPNHIMTALDSDLDNDWEVRKVNLKSGKFKVIREGAFDISQWETDQDHELRVGYGRNEKGELLATYRPPGGDWTDANDTQWLEKRIFPYGFEENPRYAIAAGPVNSDRAAIVRLDLVEDKVLEVLHEDPEFDIYPRFDDGKLIGYIVPAQDNELVLTDKKWKGMYDSLTQTFPNDQVSILSWTEDKNMLLVRARSDVDAGTIYVWDRKASKIFALGRTYPELDPKALSTMEQVSYKARDGLEITAYLTIPKGADRKNLPVVVMPHGGPTSRDTWGFDFLVQMIASRGYAVLQPNFRGSLYQGREFREAGEGEWGRKMQDDLDDGVNWMVEEGIASRGRVCIVGWSYGGYAALMGVVKNSQMYRCAASINGVSNLKELRGEYSYTRGGLRQIDKLLGVKGVNISDYSPIDQAKKISSPVLIVHAKDDGRVPFDHGSGMASALKRARGEVTFVEIESGGHSLMNGNSRLEMLQALESFLGRHLGRGARTASLGR